MNALNIDRTSSFNQSASRLLTQKRGQFPFCNDYLGRTSLCDDVTMVDECKQSTTTSSTHVKKHFQVITFHDGLKAWMDSYRHCICPGSYLKYAFPICKAKYDNRIGESLWRSWRYLICIVAHGLCSYNARLFNDDVTAIGVSYWWRREFPNYARLHPGRIRNYIYS